MRTQESKERIRVKEDDDHQELHSTRTGRNTNLKRRAQQATKITKDGCDRQHR